MCNLEMVNSPYQYVSPKVGMDPKSKTAIHNCWVPAHIWSDVHIVAIFDFGFSTSIGWGGMSGVIESGTSLIDKY
jgi:hypothetical protein